MAEASKRANVEFGEIVRAIRGDLSFEKASEAINYAVSSNALRILESGKVGRERTVRAFARGFADRICQLYGEQVKERFGECTEWFAENWLAEKAGFLDGPAATKMDATAPTYTEFEYLMAVTERMEAANREAQAANVLLWTGRDSPKFGALVRACIGDRTLEEASELTGLSVPYLRMMLGGLVPIYSRLVSFAEGLNLSNEQRSALLWESGFPVPSGLAKRERRLLSNPLEFSPDGNEVDEGDNPLPELYMSGQAKQPFIQRQMGRAWRHEDDELEGWDLFSSLLEEQLYRLTLEGIRPVFPLLPVDLDSYNADAIQELVLSIARQSREAALKDADQ